MVALATVVVETKGAKRGGAGLGVIVGAGAGADAGAGVCFMFDTPNITWGVGAGVEAGGAVAGAVVDAAAGVVASAGACVCAEGTRSQNGTIRGLDDCSDWVVVFAGVCFVAAPVVALGLLLEGGRAGARAGEGRGVLTV